MAIRRSSNTYSQNKSHTSMISPTSGKSSGQIFRGSSTSTLKGISKRDKSSKEKRRSRKSNQESSTTTSPTTTQWYTTTPELSDLPVPVTPVFELRQELTPKRPLRSEVERERRLSRTSSGQFSASKIVNNSNNYRLNGLFPSSNRDSFGTTDSTASEEDTIPPPLPQKLREADYCNLPDEGDRSSEIMKVSTPIVKVRSKPPLPEPVADSTPPTPPLKRPPQKPPRE